MNGMLSAYPAAVFGPPGAGIGVLPGSEPAFPAPGPGSPRWPGVGPTPSAPPSDESLPPEPRPLLAVGPPSLRPTQDERNAETDL